MLSQSDIIVLYIIFRGFANIEIHLITQMVEPSILPKMSVHDKNYPKIHISWS
jgi:hypothetical protein